MEQWRSSAGRESTTMRAPGRSATREREWPSISEESARGTPSIPQRASCARAGPVWAGEGAVADALATALVVAGPRGLTRFARRFRFEALLLVEKRRGGQRALATPGLVWLPAPADPARDQGMGRPSR